MSAIATGRVAQMRREFDAAFARPPAPEPPAAEALLRVSTGGTGFFVRLRDLACVLPCGVVVPVPGARPGLLGLTAVRGQILPLYSLAVLLDLPGTAPAPRWILVPANAAGAGLGVETVEGVTRTAETAVREATTSGRGDSGRAGNLPDAAGARALLDVVWILDNLRRAESKER